MLLGFDGTALLRRGHEFNLDRGHHAVCTVGKSDAVWGSGRPFGRRWDDIDRADAGRFTVSYHVVSEATRLVGVGRAKASRISDQAAGNPNSNNTCAYNRSGLKACPSLRGSREAEPWGVFPGNAGNEIFLPPFADWGLHTS